MPVCELCGNDYDKFEVTMEGATHTFSNARSIRSKCSHELRRDDLEQQFNALGTEGYELAWILMDQNLHGEKDGHVVIFKRPAPAA